MYKRCQVPRTKISKFRPQGYKTFYMLNTTEQEIETAYLYKIFLNRIHFMLSCVEDEKSFITSGPDLFTRVFSFTRILDEQEALEDFRHQDDDTDEKVSWEEYLKHEFNLNEKEIRQRDKKDKKHAKMIAVRFSKQIR